MGSVIHLNVPFRQSTKAARQAALIDRFATQRRPQNDVFWLKENAELLNVLDSTGAELDASALEPLAEVYDTLHRRLGFFPQYYRFLVSICLDLEDLGLVGNKGHVAVDWVVSEGLADAELSDLQRAEARRLCLRRGVDPFEGDTGLDDRLRAFGARQDTFALPNKKAAYELTHIVFYLSEYGRQNPDLPDAFVRSLHFAGTLAFLELNTDLLAEICIALRFSGQTPPAIWENWISDQARGFICSSDELGWAGDDYHPFLMTNWFMNVAGMGGFGVQVPDGPISFEAPRPSVAPLRELSECMYQMEGVRSSDWPSMRKVLDGVLSTEAREVVDAAETAVDFEAFFAGFARTGLQGASA
ncbi:MAG: hypothetical protein AAFW87_14010 [Pseudomonadota bacterium]